jgi:hypothetical protein
MEQGTFQQTTPPSVPPKNWLVESILVTIFCCFPIGVVAIIFAAQVNSKWAAGDYAGALESSRQAGKWTKIFFFVGLAAIILYCILFFGLGLSGLWFSRRNHY